MMKNNAQAMCYFKLNKNTMLCTLCRNTGKTNLHVSTALFKIKIM